MLKKILTALSVATSHLIAAPDPSTVFANLLQFEGCRLTPYQEKNGTDWVVGIGHNLSARKQTVRDYSMEQVKILFEQDYNEAVRAARRLLNDFDGLPEPAQLVVINLIWSVGPGGFAKFKNFRAALNYRSYSFARRELKDSKWARQVQPARLEWALSSLSRL